MSDDADLTDDDISACLQWIVNRYSGMEPKHQQQFHDLCAAARAWVEHQRVTASLIKIIPCGDGGPGKRDPDIEAMRQACADDCASLERQLEDKDATIAELRTEAEKCWKALSVSTEIVATLRAEVERLKDLLPAWKIVENNERLRARVAELEAEDK